MCGVVFADDYYYEYDYETGEERRIVITDEEMNMKMNNSLLNNYVNDSPVIEKESDVSLKSISTMSLINGHTFNRVTSLSTPYSRIMCLRLGRDTDGNGTIDNWAVGTGFLVGPDLMLTAGHCMYGAEGGNVEEMRIYSGQNSTSLQSYCYPSKWYTPDEFKNGDTNYDWCLVKLQSGLGNTYGWFDCVTPTSSISSVRVSGYPDSSEYYYFQYTSTGALYLNGNYGVRYTCSTFGGQSGAPVFDTDYVVYGIHTDGGTLYNYGKKITSRILNLINYYQW